MEADSETVFDFETTFHSANDIQQFMIIFSLENGFKVHTHQYLDKEKKEYYRGNFRCQHKPTGVTGGKKYTCPFGATWLKDPKDGKFKRP